MSDRHGSEPLLTVAVCAPKVIDQPPWGDILPGWELDSLSEIERLWVSPWAPRSTADVTWVAPYGSRRSDFYRASMGHARARWVLVLLAGEHLHVHHARTFMRFIRHMAAGVGTAASAYGHAGTVGTTDGPRLLFLPSGGSESGLPEGIPEARMFDADAVGYVSCIDREFPNAWLKTHPGESVATLSGALLEGTRPDPFANAEPSPWRRMLREISLGRLDLDRETVLDSEVARWRASLPSALRLDLAAESAFWRGELPEAQYTWERLLASPIRPFAPAAVRALVGLGRICEARGDLHGAEAQYSAAACQVPGEEESLARLAALAFRSGGLWADRIARLPVSLRGWQGIGRALDRVVPRAAQKEQLAVVEPGPLRDLLLSRAALATGDPGLAHRTLVTSELRQVSSSEARSAFTYARYLTALANGSAETARSLVLGWSGLSHSGRVALLASVRVAGEMLPVPDLPPEERTVVRYWLGAVGQDLEELGLQVQAGDLRRLAQATWREEAAVPIARLGGTVHREAVW